MKELETCSPVGQAPGLRQPFRLPFQRMSGAPSPLQAEGLPYKGIATLLLGFFLLLAPSGWFAWKFRSMPQLGAYHDDAVLLISAQSLSGNHEYRISQLPENPAQTRYPPLYPALLSLLGGRFPGNLSATTALQWSFYPVYVVLAWLYFRRCGFNASSAFGLTLVLALCPITIILGVTPLTELPFTIILLALMLLLDTDCQDFQMCLLAGILAAMAFLIRTNAIVLAASVPVFLIPRDRIRSALAFLAPLLVAIAAWEVWCFRNVSAAKDDLALYYTSYLGFYLRTFSWFDFPHRIWVNFSSVVEALARLVLFNVDNTYGVRLIGWLLTVTAAAGVVTLFRRGHRQYPIFAALSIVVLVVWEYPPDTRFVYPLFPLYVAGLATKLREIGMLAFATWRRKPGPDRAMVPVMLALIFLVAAASAGSVLHGVVSVLPEYFADREKQRAEMMPVYRWIAAHTRPDERFAAYDDTILYLNTGRRGYTVPVLPRLVYDQDPRPVQRYISGLGAFWRDKHVSYVLVTKYDFRRDLHQVALDSLRQLVQDRQQFQLLYSDGAAQLYWSYKSM